ncbi:hypothetical protein [Halioxenophilus sp. WMMB6]|uniref:hypothetical protein n=1 Tax=Halioxenophilus sp. WMMB6 TaxID=3073815 RepID=UPI00295E6220|nr:hypothetical protein [Halioxenophilus sp. WMMB6]
MLTALGKNSYKLNTGAIYKIKTFRPIRHPPSAIRHPPSAIRHPPSAIRHPPSALAANPLGPKLIDAALSNIDDPHSNVA